MRWTIRPGKRGGPLSQADVAALRGDLTALDRQAYDSGRVDADEMLRLASAGAAGTPGNSPDHGFFQFYRGSALIALSDRNLDENALDQALLALRAAVAALPHDDDLRLLALSGLGNTLQTKSLVSGNPELLAEAVEVARAALDAAGDYDEDDTARLSLLASLAKCLRAQGEHAHDLAVLREAVAASTEAVNLVDPEMPFRHGFHITQGICLVALFDETKDAAALTGAIGAMRAAIASTPDGAPELAAYWPLLGSALERQDELTADPEVLAQSIAAERAGWTTSGRPPSALDQATVASRLATVAGRTGSLDTLTEAAATWRSAAGATPADDPGYGWRQSQLREVLESLFERTGDTALLREAVAAGQAAMAAAPDHHEYWSDLAGTWHTVFLVTGELTALAEVERLTRTLIALPGLTATDRAWYLTALSVALHHRYEQTKSTQSLAEAIALQREAIVLDPGDPTSLSNLGAALNSQFELSADLDALTEGLSACRAAVAATPPGDPELGTRLGNLAGVALGLFLRTADRQALTEALEAARAASAVLLENPGPAGSGYIAHLSSLIAVLNAVYTETGDQVVLAEAVEVSRAAVAALPADYPYRARMLSSHTATLTTAYLGTGDYDLLTEAADTGRAAVATHSGDGAEDARHLSNLALALFTAYGRTGDAATLEEAVEAGRAAVGRCDPGQPDYPRYLANLAVTLMSWYRQDGRQDTAAQALDAARTAVDATPENSTDRARCLANLGTVLLFLYYGTRELEALHQAVEASRAAAATAPEHSMYGLFQGNLAQQLTLVYQRTGAVEALAEAERAARAAVGAMSPGQPWYAVTRANLGSLLFTRYGEDERQETLDEAIADLRAADRAAIGRDPNRSRWRLILAAALSARYDATRELSLLNEAVANGRGALADVSETGPDYAEAAVVLGRALRRLHAETGQADALADARDVLAKAARTASPAQDRVMAGLEQAHAETLAGDAAAAAATMKAVVELVPLVAPGLLRRGDREYRLGEIAGVGEAAAATALAVGAPHQAVELLEQARGLLLGEAMDERANLRRLRQHAPDLAGEFEQRRRQLPSADLPVLIAPESGVVPLRAADWPPGQPAAGDELGGAADRALLAKIRARRGLADFLTVPSAAQLSRQVEDGPVVMVSAAWQRGDALILTGDPSHPVRHVPLPGLTDETASAQARKLFAALRASVRGPSLRASRQAQLDLQEVLEWLWDTVAEPVLSAVGFAGQPTGEQPWPRLWWSPVGVLAFLPMHAAGYHRDPAPGRAVLDRVISSYTATVRALAYSRQAPPTAAGTADRPGDGYLIVAMPETPGAPSLSGVDREAAAVGRLLPGALVLSGPGATYDRVVEAMPRCRVAHFACHGISEWHDPGRSRLLLHDHQASPLTVGAISRLQLASPDVAYLSACSTSDTSIALADEAVHITSAFQLAGYRNVIGTLWPVSDDAATEIAEDVYRHLTGDGAQPPDSSAAARALHFATRRLRAADPGLPTAWAAHVHTGK